MYWPCFDVAASGEPTRRPPWCPFRPGRVPVRIYAGRREAKQSVPGNWPDGRKTRSTCHKKSAYTAFARRLQMVTRSADSSKRLSPAVGAGGIYPPPHCAISVTSARDDLPVELCLPLNCALLWRSGRVPGIVSTFLLEPDFFSSHRLPLCSFLLRTCTAQTALNRSCSQIHPSLWRSSTPVSHHASSPGSLLDSQSVWRGAGAVAAARQAALGPA